MPRAVSAVEDAAGVGAVAAAVDGDEVGGGGQRRQAVLRGDRGEALPAGGDLGGDLGDPGAVGERGQRPGDGEAVDAEMVAHTVEGGDELGMAEGVADARAGHAVRLGEGAHADHPRLVRVERRQGVGGCEVGIGLVEAEDRAAGEARDHLADAGAGMPAPHRVVGICQVNQWRGGLAGGEEQRLGVLGVVAVGDGDELAAEAGDVVGEGRVGAGGGDDGRAGGDEEADEVAEEAVDAFADRDVRGGDAVVGGERGLELEELGVGVHPAVCGGVGHGGDGGRGTGRRRSRWRRSGRRTGGRGRVPGSPGRRRGPWRGGWRRGGSGAWSGVFHARAEGPAAGGRDSLASQGLMAIS